MVKANAAPGISDRFACESGRVTGAKAAGGDARSIDDEVRSALASLNIQRTKANLDAMARYGIPSGNALGVAMRDIKALGKKLGCHHLLAVALSDTGVYEARM